MQGYWKSEKRGSGVYFGVCTGKEKWKAPLYRHCMRTVATLQRLDYPNQKDVFILVLSVTAMYSCRQKRGVGEHRLMSCPIIVNH